MGWTVELLVSAVLVAMIKESRGARVVAGYPREELVCWTCKDHKTNEDCNRWAPDVGCIKNHTVCMTVHIVNTTTGETLNVEKSCVRPSACKYEDVGCRRDGITTECVSCCTDSLCNEEVPINTMSANRLSTVSNLGCQTVHHPGAVFSLTLLFSITPFL